MRVYTAEELSKMSIEELIEANETLPILSEEKKKEALEKMDMGIYDESGNLVGDKAYDEDGLDIYEED